MSSSVNSSTEQAASGSALDSQVPSRLSETVDGESLAQSPLTVRLIVGQGTHAGVTAEIRVGIYMIGRHRECQIRPKSQSVSRRHCLLQHQPECVRVFDLESKRGTYVNDVRLEPKTWHEVKHGDRLRCGHYLFEVAIYRRDVDGELDPLSDSADDALDASDSNIGSGSDIGIIDEEDIVDDHVFDQDVFGGEQATRLVEEVSESTSLLDASDTTIDAEPVVKEKKTPTRLPKPKIPKPKIRRSSSGTNWISVDFGGPESWKILAAGLALIFVVGYVAWSVYKIQRGPEVKIIKGID